jgi:hypothetical protein
MSNSAIKRHADAARQIWRQADSEGRGLTEAERKTVEDHVNSAEALKKAMDLGRSLGAPDISRPNGIGGGDATGVNLDGLLNQLPGENQDIASDADAPNAADNVFAAISKAEEAHLPADGIVIHPSDWASLRVIKDQTRTTSLGRRSRTVRSPERPCHRGQQLAQRLLSARQDRAESRDQTGAPRDPPGFVRHRGFDGVLSNTLLQ